MGNPQKLAPDLSTFDHRHGIPAANEPDALSLDFLEGVQVIELEVEVIIL